MRNQVCRAKSPRIRAYKATVLAPQPQTTFPFQWTLVSHSHAAALAPPTSPQLVSSLSACAIPSMAVSAAHLVRLPLMGSFKRYVLSAARARPTDCSRARLPLKPRWEPSTALTGTRTNRLLRALAEDFVLRHPDVHSHSSNISQLVIRYVLAYL